MSEENNITAEEMGSKTWLFHEVWPIDPNAPKNTIQEYINKGYKMVIIGHVGAQSVQRVDMLMAALEKHKGDVLIVGSNDLTDNDLAQLKARAGRIGPAIPIEPFIMEKVDFEQMSLKEESYVHKVTPREQKNRERFMKRRNK